MKRFYHESSVQKRIEAIQIENIEHARPSETIRDNSETIRDTFLNPKIRGAAWVGFWLASFQQLTGINAVMFYSGQLFAADDGLSPAQASCIILWSNFTAAVCGMFLLGCFGRRTLMIGSYCFTCIGLFGMFVF